MKIGMPKNGNGINQHFGKSKSFAIATVEENKLVGIKEISAETLQHNHGGLSSLLCDEGVTVVITGGIGPGAYNALKEKGLEVIRGAHGEIEDVVKQYINRSLKDREVLCNHHDGHHEGHKE
ncbi:diguanylate cyclase [Clostridiaceae bacterium 14S0207]|nr:diguanylate cyclase [Clostridiaceae bacterium 14S0207]